MRTNILYPFSMEGKVHVQDCAFNHLLDDIILESATRHIDHWSLFACDLHPTDQKLILSHVLISEDYEDACTSFERLSAYFSECENFIQSLIDDRIDDVFHSYNYEKAQGE